MTPFFVLINGFEARVRVQVRVQSLPRASKQLGNGTILPPAALIIIAASCITEGDVTELFGASNSSVKSPFATQLAAIIISNWQQDGEQQPVVANRVFCLLPAAC